MFLRIYNLLDFSCPLFEMEVRVQFCFSSLFQRNSTFSICWLLSLLDIVGRTLFFFCNIIKRKIIATFVESNISNYYPGVFDVFLPFNCNSTTVNLLEI